MTAFQAITNLPPQQKTPLSIVEGIGTFQCDKWRTQIFARHPWFSRAMANEYRRIADSENNHVPANRWLTSVEQRLKLGRTGLFVDCHDSEIVTYSDLKPQKIHGLVAGYSATYGPGHYKKVIKHAVNEVQRVGLIFPLDTTTDYTFDEAIAALARVCNPTWWRRQLRVIAARELEQVCRELGMVSKAKAPYVSDYTLRRRYDQKHRNTKLLESLEAENCDTGYKASLAEISEKTVSNPVNRRNELMVRMRGFEECATAIGFTARFFTLTCPSSYHATLHSGAKNPKYAGATPSEAQAYLCELWARIRAKWQRQGIRCFGFRIAEPHHDGTPHWHLLLFFAPDIADQAGDIFREYALKQDTHEPGAMKYRCEIIPIDPAKGTASGYIAKYVSKNIDGYGMENAIDDETGKFTHQTAQRVEAWASTWGIRQFQQIGTASVTVWRELRRIREPLENRSLENLEQIRKACDAGDWALFVDLMGGPLVDRENVKVRPLHLHPADHQKAENQYGELCTQLMGVIMRGAGHLITRIHSWKIQRFTDEAEDNTELDFRAPPDGATWTCVNNCTDNDTRSRP
ncbi:MAG: hypothetical protein ACI87Q_002752 [Pseudohongiellaceae bacterium]|jgi:hypothetical protein